MTLRDRVTQSTRFRGYVGCIARSPPLLNYPPHPATISNAHRVINRSRRERYSVAFFGDPNSDTVKAGLEPSTLGP